MQRYIRYLPLSLFVLYSAKSLILGNASLGEASILLILGGISFLYEKYSNDNHLKQIEDKLEAHNKEFLEVAKHINEMKSHIASVKLGQSMKTSQPTINTSGLRF